MSPVGLICYTAKPDSTVHYVKRVERWFQGHPVMWWTMCDRHMRNSSAHTDFEPSKTVTCLGCLAGS